ncbi:mucin-6-like [Saccoglossus kowalevskii]
MVPHQVEPVFTDENNIKISVSEEFQVGPDIGVKYDGHNYEITDGTILTVLWNGLHHFHITIDRDEAPDIIGMCGNNNGNLEDDLQTKGGDVIDLERAGIEDFAHTWEITSSCFHGFILP